MNKGDVVGDHVNQLELIAKELVDAGHTLSDKMQVTVVLNSLPLSWDHVVTSLMHSGKELTMTTLPVLLMLKEDRMKRRKKDNASSSLMMAQSSHAKQLSLSTNSSTTDLRSNGQGNQDKKTSLKMLVINVVKEDITRSIVH
jgi:hypothetical protein